MGHTISRKSIKKIITILTAAILVLLPVGGSIREVHAEGEESSDSGMSLEHEKTVTENADGTYDLKLTVKGKVNSESSKAAAGCHLCLGQIRKYGLSDGS